MESGEGRILKFPRKQNLISRVLSLTFFLPEVDRICVAGFDSREGMKEFVGAEDKLGMKLNLLDWSGLALLGTP